MFWRFPQTETKTLRVLWTLLWSVDENSRKSLRIATYTSRDFLHRASFVNFDARHLFVNCRLFDFLVYTLVICSVQLEGG